MTGLAPAVRVELKALAYARARKLGIDIPTGVHVYTRSNGKIVGIPFVGEPMRELIRRLQTRAGLPVSGEFDERTRAWLGLTPPPPEHAYGVDLSNHQPSIDPRALRAAGTRFAWLKASEGSSYTDPYYAGHRAALGAAGVITGAYHFARPQGRAGDGTAQAQRFLGIARPRPGDLLPALDLEVNDSRLPPDVLGRWVSEFLAQVKLTCGSCVLYTYPAYWSGDMGSTHAFGSWPLWIANYGVVRPALPAGWTSYAAWQFTSTGSVPGYPGHADRNVTADLEALRIKA